MRRQLLALRNPQGSLSGNDLTVDGLGLPSCSRVRTVSANAGNRTGRRRPENSFGLQQGKGACQQGDSTLAGQHGSPLQAGQCRVPDYSVMNRAVFPTFPERAVSV